MLARERTSEKKNGANRRNGVLAREQERGYKPESASGRIRRKRPVVRERANEKGGLLTRGRALEGNGVR
jgi:hypothetical protein